MTGKIAANCFSIFYVASELTLFSVVTTRGCNQSNPSSFYNQGQNYIFNLEIKILSQKCVLKLS